MKNLSASFNDRSRKWITESASVHGICEQGQRGAPIILSDQIHDDSIAIARLFFPEQHSVINIQRVRWISDCGSLAQMGHEYH